MTPVSLQQAITPSAGQFTLAAPMAAPEQALSIAALYIERMHCVPILHALDLGRAAVASTASHLYKLYVD